MNVQRLFISVLLVSLTTASSLGVVHTGAAASAGPGLPVPMRSTAPLLPDGLSADDWGTILDHIFQAESHGSLFTSQVAKLTALDAEAGDHFGFSVAISGDTVVVGVPDGNSWIADSGSAYVFERNQGGADQWRQVAKLTADDPAVGDQFGHAVAISGDTAVVGAYSDDHGGNDNAGSAYIFERNQGGMDQWGQVVKLTAAAPSYGARFGYAVGISGDTVVVGAPYANGGAYESGLVYVFARNEGDADNWGQVAQLVVCDPEESDWLGYAVAISEDTIVAGAPRDDDGGEDAGSAYIFERNCGGLDQWGQVQRLAAGNPGAQDRFGYAVAISGDTVVIGTHGAHAAYVFERNQGGADQWGQVAKLAKTTDQFGMSVGISGDTVVVGAFGFNYGTGAAYVFERNHSGANHWGEVERLTADDAVGEEHFSQSVAISGDTIVAGAPYDDDAGDSSGSAYTFGRQGATWAQQQKPTASDAAENDRFGYSVAVSGDTAVVGAYLDDHGGNDDAGAAYIFVRNQGGADQWGQVAKLTADDAAERDYFGQSIAISGDTIVVGAPRDDDGGNNSGSAYVFARNQGGPDYWGQVKKLTASDATADDEFGCSVSISGDTVVVGAPYDGDAGSSSGSAYVFARNQGGPDYWGQVQKLTASDAEAGDSFGRAVAISGDTVVVGAYLDDHGGHDTAGSAYVFTRNHGGPDIWGQVTQMTADDAAVGDWFGHAVAISGDTVVVGAPINDISSGSAYVFERNQGGKDNWGQVQKLTAADAANYDYFGWAVSISVDTVVTGAYSDNDGGNNSGSAYAFERNQGGADNWGQVEKVTAHDTAEGDYFGYAVSISGNVVVVGAPYDDDGGYSSGSAYVYRWMVAKTYLPLVLR